MLVRSVSTSHACNFRICGNESHTSPKNNLFCVVTLIASLSNHNDTEAVRFNKQTKPLNMHHIFW